jgi:hypothetical protein
VKGAQAQRQLKGWQNLPDPQQRGQPRYDQQAQRQPQQRGVDQVAVGVRRVARHIPREQSVQAVIGDDLEPAKNDDGEVILARVGRPQHAQHEGRKAQVDRPVHQVQGHGRQRVLGHAPRGRVDRALAVEVAPGKHG